MSLYAIGDLHLSLGGSKSMEVFGGRWEDYVRKLSEGFSGLCDDDLTVLCGDISWGMSMEESLEDFLFIDRLPGKKIILKGCRKKKKKKIIPMIFGEMESVIL